MLLLVLALACAPGVLAAAPPVDYDQPDAVLADPGFTPTEKVVHEQVLPLPDILPTGVRIGGVEVGGLSPRDAIARVRATFARPLTLVAGRVRLTVDPRKLGALAYTENAVYRARHVAARTDAPLTVVLRGSGLRAYLDSLARQFERAPVDSRLFLRNLKPYVTKGATGRALDRVSARKAIVDALLHNRREPIQLGMLAVAPSIGRDSFGPVIVIRRGGNLLTLYDGMKLVRQFGVATGQTRYPTPLGRFQVAVKWRNPWWYPPSSDWAQGLKPIPPGPGNPLGTRWMGITSPGVGIHGTPDDASIGYSLSHGCVRMHISQAEWLFEHVEIGTPVFIVAA